MITTSGARVDSFPKCTEIRFEIRLNIRGSKRKITFIFRVWRLSLSERGVVVEPLKIQPPRFLASAAPWWLEIMPWLPYG